MQETVIKAKNKIKELRTSKNLSRAEFSKLSGVPVRTIEDVETNEKNDPRLSTLLKITTALDITINDLYL